MRTGDLIALLLAANDVVRVATDELARREAIPAERACAVREEMHRLWEVACVLQDKEEPVVEKVSGPLVNHARRHNPGGVE